MAILGYALEYELMTPRGRISTRLTEETFFLVVGNHEMDANIRLIFFLEKIVDAIMY